METLREKHTSLEQEVVNKIGELLEKKGVNCTTQSQTEVLRVLDKEMMWNLEGGRYLVELNETTLFDNNGYTYSLESLSLEQLCDVVDSIAESCYDFRVGTMLLDGQRLFKYFDNKEKAYEFFIEVRAKIIDTKKDNGEVWTEERREDGDYESGDYYNIDEDELEEEIFNDNEGNELKVGDKVKVVDGIDLESDGELDDGTPLTVVKLLELDSNYITFKDSDGILYDFFGHRVKKDI